MKRRTETKKAFVTALAVIAASALCLTAGCVQTGTDDVTSSESGTSEIPDGGQSQEQLQTQPDPLESRYETKPSEDGGGGSDAEQTQPESETGTEDTSETASDGGGALNEVSDEELIAKAQKLFEDACNTSWKYHVGCPYNLDYEQYVENDLGWLYYLVTDSGVDSLDDVLADYGKVFSDKYENDLGELYIEKDGRLYAFDGARGSDIYYESSEITKVKEKNDGEILFEVENRYSGDDYGQEGEITKTADFSAVISEDGTWKAGKFTLPY